MMAADDRGYSRHGDNPADPMQLIWWSVRGRATEIALCKYLGVEDSPLALSWREAQSGHFDTPPPWAVQVKSVGHATAGLTIGLSKRHCWHCPYVLAYAPDVVAVCLIGWATAAEVRNKGYQVRWARGGSSMILPQRELHPMPATDLHARSWRYGRHSPCPYGRGAPILVSTAK